MSIPLVDLKAQYASLSEEMVAAVTGVMERGDFILGQQVDQFQTDFADYVGAKYCFGVASGTDALHVALLAVGIGPGDEVLIPANTFIATALAVTQVGATPVLVDVRPDTFNIDPEQLESKLTEKTRAVMPVHLYGQPVDMPAIAAFAEKNNLIVVEDACQAHGAILDGKRCGSFGAAAGFSFYPGKNLGAYGDGGAITTSDDAVAERIGLLRNYGQKVKYVHTMKGGNSRLDTMQAAVLNVKLKHLDDWSRARRNNAVLYHQYLGDVEQLTLPQFDKDTDMSHVFHLFVVRAEARDDLLSFLKEKEVFCGIHYPIPIHLLEAYADLGHKEGSFPVTEKAANEIISLPMYGELTEEQVVAVADGIKEFYAA